MQVYFTEGDGNAVSVLTQAEALSLGVTGPMLRATGIDYDVRKDHPYLVYEQFDFEVPVGEDGDLGRGR